ncbi:MAG: flagellar basal-body rod protein FlgF [Mariprofundales bacterium]
MDRGFYIAGSGADLTRQLKMDIISNNLANVNTVGFKADQNGFATVMSDLTSKGGSAYLGAGKRFTDTSEGAIRQTDNPLDLAISGKGFFRVQQTDGTEAYTRAGNFQLDSEGNVITQGGLKVLDDSGSAITLPSGAITITPEGAISVDGNAVAKVGMADILDETKMGKKGGTLFVTEQQNTRPSEQPLVRQGALEQANVNAVLSMARMVNVTRAFQNMMKVVEIYNQQSSQLTEKIGRVG